MIQTCLIFKDRLSQKQALDDFCQRWFQDEEGSFIAAFNPYDDLAQFESRLESHLSKLLQRRFPSTDTQSHLKAITWQAGSPFRGLSVFDADHCFGVFWAYSRGR